MSPHSPETRTRLGIVGAGTMGSGIALAALYARQAVVLFDVSGDVLERGLAYLKHHLERKGELEALAGLTAVHGLDALGAVRRRH